MQTHELDQSYTALAQAIGQAGPQSELFLAMLSLKLITQQQSNAQTLEAIKAALQDLKRHSTNPPNATSQ